MRKEPRQARSRATVDVILEAGTQVLGRQGWASFTTNEVAAVAGVSIGSFYQYFPNKLVLVDAIRRRHLEDVLAVVQSASEGPVESSVERLVEGMFRIHGSAPVLHRALLEEAPRTKEMQRIHAIFEADYLRCYKALVSMHRKRRNSPAAGVVVQIVAAAVEGLVHYAAINGLLNSPIIKCETVALVRAYLRAGERASSSSNATGGGP
jgi:AcrR family transcriptional regulator